jgi:hypothetical protein
MTMARSLWTSVLAAGVAAMWAGVVIPAEAGIVIVPSSVTFVATGTVTEGADPAGLFGGGDLSGLSYTASYTVPLTPSKVSPYYCCVETTTGPGGTVSQLGTFLDSSATITINGHTVVLTGNGSATNFASSDLGDERMVEVDGHTSGGVPASLGSSVIRKPGLWLGVPEATSFFENNIVTGSTGFGVSSLFAASDGTIADLSVSSISQHLDGTMEVPIPEISTWSMLLLGFAGLGYTGYRKARQPRAA